MKSKDVMDFFHDIGMEKKTGGSADSGEFELFFDKLTKKNQIGILADYLSGDTYFKISRENHNLDRCRTQFKLVADMEREIEELNVFVKSL